MQTTSILRVLYNVREAVCRFCNVLSLLFFNQRLLLMEEHLLKMFVFYFQCK